MSRGGQPVKDITIALPEGVARWLPIRAAQDGLSMSPWPANMLHPIQRQEAQYEVAMSQYLAMKPHKPDWPDDRRPRREELYDRASLC